MTETLPPAQECGWKDWNHAENGCLFSTQAAITLAARYIEKHETPPVDPVLAVTLAAVKAWFAAPSSDSTNTIPLTSPNAINRPDVIAAANVIRASMVMKGDA